MDGTLYYQRNQCQWISSTENVMGHNISETSKRCPTKTVQKLKKINQKKSGFIIVKKIYKNQKPKNPKGIKENQNEI